MTASVVIPCYNAAAFLAQTIDSVLAQSVPAREIVCVDDGSTDSTAVILDGYKDRVTILRHPGGVNRGLAVSRNLGLASVTADAVAFLDSDDSWTPDFLESHLQVLASDPQVGVVVSNSQAVNERDEFCYDFPVPPPMPDEELPAALLLDCFIQTPGQALVRRATIEQVGTFDEQLYGAEDHDMWIRLAEITRFRFLPDVRLNYRKHTSQMSNVGALRMWRSGYGVVTKAAARRDYGAVVSKRSAVLSYRIAMCNWHGGAYPSALYWFAQAVRQDPGRVWGELKRPLFGGRQ